MGLIFKHNVLWGNFVRIIILHSKVVLINSKITQVKSDLCEKHLA